MQQVIFDAYVDENGRPHGAETGTVVLGATLLHFGDAPPGPQDVVRPLPERPRAVQAPGKREKHPQPQEQHSTGKVPGAAGVGRGAGAATGGSAQADQGRGGAGREADRASGKEPKPPSAAGQHHKHEEPAAPEMPRQLTAIVPARPLAAPAASPAVSPTRGDKREPCGSAGGRAPAATAAAPVHAPASKEKMKHAEHKAVREEGRADATGVQGAITPGLTAAGAGAGAGVANTAKGSCSGRPGPAAAAGRKCEVPKSGESSAGAAGTGGEPAERRSKGQGEDASWREKKRRAPLAALGSQGAGAERRPLAAGGTGEGAALAPGGSAGDMQRAEGGRGAGNAGVIGAKQAQQQSGQRPEDRPSRPLQAGQGNERQQRQEQQQQQRQQEQGDRPGPSQVPVVKKAKKPKLLAGPGASGRQSVQSTPVTHQGPSDPLPSAEGVTLKAGSDRKRGTDAPRAPVVGARDEPQKPPGQRPELQQQFGKQPEGGPSRPLQAGRGDDRPQHQHQEQSDRAGPSQGQVVKKAKKPKLLVAPSATDRQSAQAARIPSNALPGANGETREAGTDRERGTDAPRVLHVGGRGEPPKQVPAKQDAHAHATGVPATPGAAPADGTVCGNDSGTPGRNAEPPGAAAHGSGARRTSDGGQSLRTHESGGTADGGGDEGAGEAAVGRLLERLVVSPSSLEGSPEGDGGAGGSVAPRAGILTPPLPPQPEVEAPGAPQHGLDLPEASPQGDGGAQGHGDAAVDGGHLSGGPTSSSSSPNRARSPESQQGDARAGGCVGAAAATAREQGPGPPPPAGAPVPNAVPSSDDFWSPEEPDDELLFHALGAAADGQDLRAEAAETGVTRGGAAVPTAQQVEAGLVGDGPGGSALLPGVYMLALDGATPVCGEQHPEIQLLLGQEDEDAGLEQLGEQGGQQGPEGGVLGQLQVQQEGQDVGQSGEQDGEQAEEEVFFNELVTEDLGDVDEADLVEERVDWLGEGAGQEGEGQEQQRAGAPSAELPAAQQPAQQGQATERDPGPAQQQREQERRAHEDEGPPLSPVLLQQRVTGARRHAGRPLALHADWYSAAFDDDEDVDARDGGGSQFGPEQQLQQQPQQPTEQKLGGQREAINDQQQQQQPGTSLPDSALQSLEHPGVAADDPGQAAGAEGPGAGQGAPSLPAVLVPVHSPPAETLAMAADAQAHWALPPLALVDAQGTSSAPSPGLAATQAGAEAAAVSSPAGSQAEQVAQAAAAPFPSASEADVGNGTSDGQAVGPTTVQERVRMEREPSFAHMAQPGGGLAFAAHADAWMGGQDLPLLNAPSEAAGPQESVLVVEAAAGGDIGSGSAVVGSGQQHALEGPQDGSHTSAAADQDGGFRAAAAGGAFGEGVQGSGIAAAAAATDLAHALALPLSAAEGAGAAPAPALGQATAPSLDDSLLLTAEAAAAKGAAHPLVVPTPELLPSLSPGLAADLAMSPDLAAYLGTVPGATPDHLHSLGLPPPDPAAPAAPAAAVPPFSPLGADASLADLSGPSPQAPDLAIELIGEPQVSAQPAGPPYEAPSSQSGALISLATAATAPDPDGPVAAQLPAPLQPAVGMWAGPQPAAGEHPEGVTTSPPLPEAALDQLMHGLTPLPDIPTPLPYLDEQHPLQQQEQERWELPLQPPQVVLPQGSATPSVSAMVLAGLERQGSQHGAPAAHGGMPEAAHGLGVIGSPGAAGDASSVGGMLAGGTSHEQAEGHAVQAQGQEEEEVDEEQLQHEAELRELLLDADTLGGSQETETMLVGQPLPPEQQPGQQTRQQLGQVAGSSWVSGAATPDGLGSGDGQPGGGLQGEPGSQQCQQLAQSSGDGQLGQDQQQQQELGAQGQTLHQPHGAPAAAAGEPSSLALAQPPARSVSAPALSQLLLSPPSTCEAALAAIAAAAAAPPPLPSPYHPGGQPSGTPAEALWAHVQRALQPHADHPPAHLSLAPLHAAPHTQPAPTWRPCLRLQAQLINPVNHTNTRVSPQHFQALSTALKALRDTDQDAAGRGAAAGLAGSAARGTPTCHVAVSGPAPLPRAPSEQQQHATLRLPPQLALGHDLQLQLPQLAVAAAGRGSAGGGAAAHPQLHPQQHTGHHYGFPVPRTGSSREGGNSDGGASVPFLPRASSLATSLSLGHGHGSALAPAAGAGGGAGGGGGGADSGLMCTCYTVAAERRGVGRVQVEVQLLTCRIPGAVGLHRVCVGLQVGPPAAPCGAGSKMQRHQQDAMVEPVAAAAACESGGQGEEGGEAAAVNWLAALRLLVWLACGVCQVAACASAEARLRLLRQLLLQPGELLTPLPPAAEPLPGQEQEAQAQEPQELLPVQAPESQPPEEAQAEDAGTAAGSDTPSTLATGADSGGLGLAVEQGEAQVQAPAGDEAAGAGGSEVEVLAAARRAALAAPPDVLVDLVELGLLAEALPLLLAVPFAENEPRKVGPGTGELGGGGGSTASLVMRRVCAANELPIAPWALCIWPQMSASDALVTYRPTHRLPLPPRQVWLRRVKDYLVHPPAAAAVTSPGGTPPPPAVTPPTAAAPPDQAPTGPHPAPVGMPSVPPNLLAVHAPDIRIAHAALQRLTALHRVAMLVALEEQEEEGDRGLGGAGADAEDRALDKAARRERALAAAVAHVKELFHAAKAVHRTVRGGSSRLKQPVFLPYMPACELCSSKSPHRGWAHTLCYWPLCHG